MKNLRQICASMVLLLALGVTATAGEMDATGKTLTTSSKTAAVSASLTPDRAYDAITEAVLLFSHKLFFLL